MLEGWQAWAEEAPAALGDTAEGDKTHTVAVVQNDPEDALSWRRRLSPPQRHFLYWVTLSEIFRASYRKAGEPTHM